MPSLASPLVTLANRQRGLLTREQLLAAGWRDGQVRAAARGWRTVLPGTYLVTGRLPDREIRAMAATLRWPAAVLSHVTAARWRDWPVLDRPPRWPGLLLDQPAYDPEIVHVCCPSRLRKMPGFALHQASPGAVVSVRDARLTAPLRTLYDVAAAAPLTVSVPLIDAVSRTDPRLLDGLAVLLRAKPGHRHVGRAQRAVALACPGAESVLESLLRLLIVLAGLPAPESQVAVRIGTTSYRADLGYPLHRLLIEADGRDYHAEWSAVAADMARQNTLVAEGWRVLRFTWSQVLYQPEMVIAALRAALRDQ